MKKKAIFILLYFAGLIALLHLLSGIMIPKKNLAEYGMEEERANGILGEKENTIDVLMLGNSLIYTDFIPPQMWKDTGYTSYTCGTNDQHLDYSLEMLRRTLKHQKPTVVFLETDSFTREVTALNALLSEASHFFPCFRYHDRWKHMKLRDFIPPFTTENCYQSRFMGYVFHEKIDSASIEDQDKNAGNSEKIGRWNLIYLQSIAKLCKKNDIKLVLISMPNLKGWAIKKHNRIDTLAKDLECEYIDLNYENDKVGIDWKADTIDAGEHMNYSGAMKVTRYITQYLEQTNLLEDHRSDPQYSDWEKHLRKYEKQLKKRERRHRNSV